MRICLFFMIAILLNCSYSNPFDKEKNNPSPLFLSSFLYLAQSSQCRHSNQFWVRNFQKNTSECLSFQKVAEGENAILYRERRLHSNLNYETILQDFDKKIHPSLVQAFGEPSDINQDNRITILILDIRDGAVEGGPFVAGFFDPMDLLPDNPSSLIRSNEQEILYLDGKELVEISFQDPLAIGSTLAHEFQHLIRFPKMYEAGSMDEIWIDEGSSELASDIAGFGPQTHRLDCLLGKQNSKCPGGANNVSLVDWGRSPENDTSYLLKQYAYAYSFLSFLFHNSAPTHSGRIEFLYHTSNGAFGIRASHLIHLMKLFRIHRNQDVEVSFPTNPLGESPEQSFFLLLHSFWSQILPYTDITSITNYKTLPPSNMNLESPNSIQEIFPLEGWMGSGSPLLQLKNYNNFPIRDSIPSIVPPTSVNVIQGSLPSNLIVNPKRISIFPTHNQSNQTIVHYEWNPNGRWVTNQASLVSLRVNHNHSLSWNHYVKNFEKSNNSHHHANIFYFQNTKQLYHPHCGTIFLGRP